MLESTGMTERQLKARERKRIRHRLLYDQMISLLAYQQYITRRDVEAFPRGPPRLAAARGCR